MVRFTIFSIFLMNVFIHNPIQAAESESKKIFNKRQQPSRKKPITTDFGSEKAFKIAWNRWKKNRNANNKSVRICRQKISGNPEKKRINVLQRQLVRLGDEMNRYKVKQQLIPDTLYTKLETIRSTIREVEASTAQPFRIQKYPHLLTMPLPLSVTSSSSNPDSLPISSTVSPSDHDSEDIFGATPLASLFLLPDTTLSPFDYQANPDHLPYEGDEINQSAIVAATILHSTPEAAMTLSELNGRDL